MSEANIRSTSPAWMSVTLPSLVITMLSSTTLRYAGFSLTRRSTSGRSSSRAVASRIAPDRCVTPSSSTYPRGNSNSNSVRRSSRAGGAPGGAVSSCAVTAGALTARRLIA